MQFHHDSTLVMGDFGYLAGRGALLVGFLVVSVLKFDMAVVVNNIRVTSGFGLQVMLVESLGV